MAAEHDASSGAHEQDSRPDFRDRVESVAEAQKQRAADSLGSAAATARDTGQRLRGDNDFVASWVSAAGDQLQLLADRLRDRRPGELLDEVSRFARERPAVFLGGAFVLGLGVARLLKSTSDHRGRGASAPEDSGTRMAGDGTRMAPDDFTSRTGANEWTPHAVS